MPPDEQPPASPGSPSNVKGRVISSDELEQLKRFREKFFPDTRLEAQDTYAKWLFALTTTVAALGSGFSNAAFAKLSSLGALTYSVAVLAAGAGLACAVFVLSVELPAANWQSLEGMIDAFKEPLKKKNFWLIGATLCLGASLILAAAAALVTSIERQPSKVASGIGVRFAERKLEPSITLSRLSPGVAAELRILQKNSGKTKLIGVFRQIADDDGQISYKGPEIKVAREAEGLVLVLTYERRGKSVSEATDFDFPAEPAPPKDSSGKGPGADSKESPAGKCPQKTQVHKTACSCTHHGSHKPRPSSPRCP
jgi:hypothetical protein